MRRSVALSMLCVMAVLTGCTGEESDDPVASSADNGSTFEFGIIGDYPYDASEETQFERLRRDINSEDLAFIVHVGDIKAPPPCSGRIYHERRQDLDEFAAPLVYTPGDNDWLDCQLFGADPIERLAFLRKVFFGEDRSLGRRAMSLSRQSKAYPENQRWAFQGVTFATLHVVGNANNVPRKQEGGGDRDEYNARNSANLDWMQETFDLAKDSESKAIVFVMQADPRFDLPPARRSGFNDLLELLEDETLVYGKPVVLVHGDTHYFRVDKPLIASGTQRQVQHFTRVESFGSPEVHWVRALVDPTDPEVFTFRAEIVAENVVS